MSDDTSPAFEPETVIGPVIQRLREAGAPSEQTYERDGGFSYHAESHAFGVGFGVGLWAGATGDYQYAGAIIAAAFGLNRGPQLSSPRILEDIKQEPHYAIFGVAVGFLLGNPSRVVSFL